MSATVEYVPVRVNTTDRDALKEIKNLLITRTKRPVTLTEVVHNAITMYYTSLVSPVSDTKTE